MYNRIHAYKNKGIDSLIHGNTGRKRIMPRFSELKPKILEIFHRSINGKDFQGISYSHFQAILDETFKIHVSKSFIKKVLMESGYVSPFSKKLKKKQKSHLIRERREHFGELLQVDGSEHDWFRNGKKVCLHGFIDDATGKFVAGYFCRHECRFGYQECLRITGNKYGLPEALYTDKARIFFNVADGKVLHDKKTQFGEMLSELGIQHIAAYSSQAKGRVERMWLTVQNQLPFWLWLRGIDTLEKANDYLPVFIDWFNKTYSVPPASKESYFVKCDTEELNACLKITTVGKTDKGGMFTLYGYRFLCKDLPDQKVKICLSVKEGLWVESPVVFKSRHYPVELIETDTSGPMPEVWKELVEVFFLQNAKPLYREVYKEFIAG